MENLEVLQHPSYYERFDANTRRRVLDSGLTLIHVPQEGQQSFYLGATIACGTRLEPGNKLGISHFLEHMMFRGSQKFPEYAALAEAFESYGGEWNAATSHEHTEYLYVGIGHTAGGVLELFADFLQNPLFRELETERSIILRELDAETNELGHSTDLSGHIASLLWPHSSLDRPILGTRESLKEISLEDIVRYRNTFYIPSRMVISAIGGPTNLLSQMEKAFSSPWSSNSSFRKGLKPLLLGYPSLHEAQLVPSKVATGTKQEAFSGPKVKWVEHNDNEYEIKLAFTCPHEWSPKAPLLHLISRILGDGFSSRLTSHLREKLGLVYDISCQTNLGLDHGTIEIDAACSLDQFDQFNKELFLLLKNFRTHGVLEKELERVRFRSLVDLELSLNHPEALGGRLAWASLCQQNWSLSQHVYALGQVTVNALNELIDEIFDASRLAMVVLGPKQEQLESRMLRSIKNLK